MNPWKAMGWIMLALLVYSLYTCGKVANDMAGVMTERGTPTATSASAATTAPPVSEPPINVDFIDLSCTHERNYSEAKLTIRNTSVETLKYASVFFKFIDANGATVATEQGAFFPTTVPPGAVAEASVFGPKFLKAHTCGLLGVQTANGRAIGPRDSPSG